MTPLKELAQFARDWLSGEYVPGSNPDAKSREIAALLETLSAADAKMPVQEVYENDGYPITIYVLRVDALAAVAAAHLQPVVDCRGCKLHFTDKVGNSGCSSIIVSCTNGDKFQQAAPVQLYRVKP